ncbi:toxic anion resistance protein TelA domain protein [Peptoniphilus sp. oral taxon 375 str. F0436]|nr:toxic anion resistance protein TelA domain protein [Peptoniphilus sp. oral taxon 375 str. F0436]
MDQIAKSLEGHQIQLLKDISTLDQMYDLNLSYYKELTMYIQAGEKRLEKAKIQELPALEAKALESKLPIDAQKAQDFRSSIDRFEKNSTTWT